jgi:prepilin-type N-terminal cleavage/methylation domain-containing protein
MIPPRPLRIDLRREGGFTMIELLVVMIILLAVVGAILTLFTSALRGETDLAERVRAQEAARLALDTLRRDVHCASETSGLVPDVPSSAVTFLLPTGCPSATTEYVTWCTKPTAVASRYTLYRVPGADCAAGGGVTWADHLTATDIFTYAHPSGSRARLNVELVVDVDPTSDSRAYALRDALVLRNSER